MSDSYVGNPELKPIWDLGNLVRENVEQVTPETEGAVSVGFFFVAKKSDATVTVQELIAHIKAATKGYYSDEPVERLVQGPSYIELGGWIGDQGLALCLMGLGAILGLWKIITPEALGVTGEKAQQMKGSGFVMIVPGPDSPLLS